MKIGIDIGGSHIAAGIVDEKGKIIKKIQSDIKENKNMTKDIVDYVDKAIQKLLKLGDILEIGIASPGNANGTIIKNLVNLGVNEIDFNFLKEKYKVPVKAINDAKAAALAEKEYGSLHQLLLCQL